MGISIGSGIGGSGIGSSGIGGSGISGSSFSPLDLSPLAWARSSISTLYQDSAGTTPITAAGQDVGLREDQSGNSADFTQATATARPTYETSPARLEYDVDDALSCTLPAISGGQIVIISPAGTWIDSLDFAGGTFTVGPDTYTGGPAGLMSLLGNAETEIIILPTPMTTAEQAKMVSYAQGLGSAGLITLGSDVITNGDFSGGTAGWSTAGAGVSITGGAAVFTSADNGNNVLQSTLSIVTGRTYLVEYLLSRTAGSFSSGMGSGLGSLQSTSGHKRDIITATSSNVYVRARAPATSGSVDNISVREVIMP